jgi:Transglycosylase SLT domain
MQHRRLARFGSFAIGLLALFGVFSQAKAACLDHIVAAERDYQIPQGMLLAVSLVESGGGGVPNPYIMNVRGKVVFSKSEAEAASRLRDKQGQWHSQAYVGCMQLSLASHKQSFRPAEKIVNPEANVRYAARYLASLRRETGSWAGAVARYNGSSGAKAVAYQCKVHSQLMSLGAAGSADLISASACSSRTSPAIAPRTRRAFEKHKETSRQDAIG